MLKAAEWDGEHRERRTGAEVPYKERVISAAPEESWCPFPS